MLAAQIFCLLITASLACAKCNIAKNSSSTDEKFHLVYQWQYINFTWPTREKYQEAVSSGRYATGNSVILGVKYYKEKFYFALPKIKPGSPVSLAFVPEDGEERNPLLVPYPNWAVHLSDKCEENLANLQSMEIDEEGVMWIIDGRRVDPTPASKNCPPKIVLLDLNRDQIVQSYVLPDEVCSHKSCFMNDVVLDKPDEVDGGFAYISDSSFTDPGLIVYSRKQNKAWKLRDSTMFAEPPAIIFTSHGISQSKSNNVNGIALAPRKRSNDKHRTLYFTALSAFTLYSIDTALVRDESLATSKNIHSFINEVGKKPAQSSGMIVDTSGQLFYGLVAEDEVIVWDTAKPFSTARVIEKNPQLIPWPDSYTFDNKGYLHLLASNVDRFGAGRLSIEDYNFKLLKLYTGTCSYIYS